MNLVSDNPYLQDGKGDKAAVAIAFVLAHPARPVAIIGSQRVERLQDAATALEVGLSRADAYRIIEAAEGVPLP